MIVHLNTVRDRTRLRPWSIEPVRTDDGPALLVHVESRFGHPGLCEIFPAGTDEDAELAVEFASAAFQWIASRCTQ